MGDLGNFFPPSDSKKRQEFFDKLDKNPRETAIRVTYNFNYSFVFNSFES